ncbi:MAG TPA: flagellar protein FlaG [Bacillota bacterium]|nr:flagellar protein FlaG [Bacillota bacterium]
MKIGAGGLQAQVAQEVAPVNRIESVRLKPAEEIIGTDVSNYKAQVNRADLFKAVEKLNSAAALFNRPYELRVREKDRRIKVELVAKGKSRVVKEIPAERVLGLADDMEQAMGLMVDEQV